jgi:hypothetical protein
MTVRELIEALTAATARLPAALDTDVELGVCDGENLQMIGTVDVNYWARVAPNGTPKGYFVLVQGHPHLDEGGPARPLRGVTADVDDELRKLTEHGED